jgi:hypothetical protein
VKSAVATRPLAFAAVSRGNIQDSGDAFDQAPQGSSLNEVSTGLYFVEEMSQRRMLLGALLGNSINVSPIGM